MERKTVLVIADLGGCPPHMFYKSAAEKYNLVSFIPRPFAITASHAALIEKYSVAVIKDKDYFKSLADFEHPDSIYWAHEDHNKPEEEVVEQIVKVAEMFGADAITTNNELFIAPMAKACERLGLRGAGVQAAENARDKNKMRDAFNKAGVKSIKNRPAFLRQRMPKLSEQSFIHFQKHLTWPAGEWRLRLETKGSFRPSMNFRIMYLSACSAGCSRQRVRRFLEIRSIRNR